MMANSFHCHILIEVPMQTVRLPLWLVAVVLSMIAGMAISGTMSPAISQDKPAARHCDVAVLDVSRLFEKFDGFQKEMQGLKSDVDSFELVLKQAQSEQAELRGRIEATAERSAERRELEAEFNERNTYLRKEMETKRSGFLAKEAEFYAVRYREVEKAVRNIAAQRELRLALRFSSEALNDKDRKSVLQTVNRPIVFQDQLDITDEVIKALNEA
jgi:Skp family chaperone for outer membrane proteins